MENRIEELEIRVAFQDELLAKLSDQVHAAFLEIERLRAELRQLRDAPTSGSDGAKEPPPPHY